MAIGSDIPAGTYKSGNSGSEIGARSVTWLPRIGRRGAWPSSRHSNHFPYCATVAK
jgi:hypothetical protein